MVFFNTNVFKYLSLYVLTKVVYSNDKIKQFVFSKEFDLDSKICIYGFGPYGRSIFRKLFYYSDIAGIFDLSLNKFYRNILSPDDVCECTFDYIIVTVMNEDGKARVLRFLLENNVPAEKIITINSN